MGLCLCVLVTLGVWVDVGRFFGNRKMVVMMVVMVNVGRAHSVGFFGDR